MFRGLVFRSLYSPLVESFGIAKRNPSSDVNSENDLNDSRAWNTSSPADTPTQQQEQTEASVNAVDEGNDGIQSAPQDPLTDAYGDGAHAEKLAG